MNIFSLATAEFAFLQITSSLEELMPYINRFVKDKRNAEILLNGEIIGRVREDLTQRLGFGYYVNDELLKKYYRTK